MDDHQPADRTGQTAVIFVSRRNGLDEAGYAAAAARMDALAATQPGYRGVESARDVHGFGITVSYWADDAAARAWRDQAEHAATRAAGREGWYDAYSVTVATVTRTYSWERD
ncbi:Heme-degrading monooxygenase HmoA [Sphingomonas gellani]|uniref:Heme-degrading monooxygenase HmoA n=1 Tax=Sphingomonas gellani TaxID=1166340 RepID=A0A1H8H9D1_9SPHN|nr:antibiotic biosynthesis monooxygenase [Sphingomonas gellani]SEN52941.1 Heme-degrading monooxygenase HmoA [Sphingomonas gellani]